MTLLRMLQLTILACLSSLAASPPLDTQGRIQKITSCISDPVVVKDDPQPCRTLSQRMMEMHVPGVSIAVIHEGVIEWAQGFGVRQIGGSPVDSDTLFQAGSISKPVAALAALRLVQEGKLTLDADVNSHLTGWKIPSSSLAPNAQVTLRELLTHTAGMSVHGFPGYAANAPVPTLVQVLNGEKPANTPPIRLESVPGSKWNYSGGGYTIMQQLLLDLAKEPFPKLLHDKVLVPAGMTHSTYEQPLPSVLLSNAATPYNAHGAAVSGGAHTYPEMAAAGLWTTPSDVARYVLETQQSLHGKTNHILSQQSTQQMLTSGKGNWGLGLQLGGSASNPYFSHGGSNEGFESLFVGYENSGDGAVVMTNAQSGSQLASEVMGSIAVEYGWPDFRPIVRTTATVSSSVLARYAGTYEPMPGFKLTFTLEGNQLMAEANGQDKQPVFPESETKFFLKVSDVEFEFFPGRNGEVTMILRQGGREMKAAKK